MTDPPVLTVRHISDLVLRLSLSFSSSMAKSSISELHAWRSSSWVEIPFEYCPKMEDSMLIKTSAMCT